MNKQLLVKHFPKCFTEEEIKKFLLSFGAIQVSTFNPNCKMRHNAFASFIDEISAKIAMQKLHQLDVLGNLLVVEFAKNNDQNSSQELLFKNPKDEMEKNLNEFYSNLNFISPKFNLNFPISPLLKYKYPEATPFIIRNIAKALYDFPKFYNQVLHLMNKMNLPPPFINSDYDFEEIFLPKSFDCKKIDLKSESSESEIETTFCQQNENLKNSNKIYSLLKEKLKKNKRKLENDGKIQKKSCLESTKSKENELNVLIKKTFDDYQILNKKNIKFKINENIEKPQIDNTKDTIIIDEFKKFTSIHVDKNLNENNEEKIIEFITDEELKNNLIPESDFCKYSVFNNYKVGEPCTRLYIKNINKKVTDLEMKKIYGKFIDWSNEEQTNFFSINLLKKGKLNGQAFVTMPSINLAKLALEKTHGLMVQGKPIVVCFARSKFEHSHK